MTTRRRTVSKEPNGDGHAASKNPEYAPARRRPRSTRPYQPRGERRRIVQEITLTEREQAEIRAKARQLGMSVPRLMVEATLSDVMTRAERVAWIEELSEANRLLANVTGSVNQLARQANVAGQVVTERELLARLVRLDAHRANVERLLTVLA